MARSFGYFFDTEADLHEEMRRTCEAFEHARDGGGRRQARVYPHRGKPM